MVSLIITVFNEASTIVQLLESVAAQTQLPDEVVIVDAASTDGTVDTLNTLCRKHPELSLRVFVKPGNRSVGRNFAIRNASYDIIAATDAGCILDIHWLEELMKPFRLPEVDFVGGWYQPIAQTRWQQSLATVLHFTPPNPTRKRFLPSTRSMAFRKSLWEKIGGFDERLHHNEDTPFSLQMIRRAKKYVIAPTAIVRWQLVSGYRQLHRMIFRYYQGDGFARLFLLHHFIVTAVVSATVLLVSLSFFVTPWLALAALGLLLAYLFLPILYSPKPLSWVSLIHIPLIRSIMIWAMICGYLKGLLQTTSTVHF